MDRHSKGPSIVAFGIAVASALAYSLYTCSAWEDWFIVFRASRHLAHGDGLVSQIGERVQAFSSPVGALLAALLTWVAGNDRDALVLWLFRAWSIAALGVTAMLLVNIGRAMRLLPAATVVLVGLLVVDAKILEFSTDGMETGFGLLFVALALHALFAPGRRAVLELSVAFAGLMWTRPDGFVHGGALALGCLLFHPRAAGAQSRPALLRACVVAAAIGAALYLPWFAWAWWYYGSPLPHSVVAKSLDLAQSPLATMTLSYPLRLLASPLYGDQTFLPFYQYQGGWPKAVAILANLTIVAGYYWMVPLASRQARAASFAFMCTNYYLTVLTPSAPWYYPQGALVGIVVLASASNDGFRAIAACEGPLLDRAAAWRLRAGVRALGALAVAASLAVTVCAAYERRVQQRVTDEGNRKEVALWLRTQARSPGDSVFVEPLGYIGFFSNLKMYDYPGLSSPEMVAARREVGNHWAALIRRLDPDWLVLRAAEMANIEADDPALLTERYQAARRFDVSEQLRSYRWLPGRDLLMIDQAFVVFKRKQ